MIPFPIGPSNLCCIVGIDDALLIAAAASVASAGIGYMGAQSANAANTNINKSTMEFNWQAQQNAADRNVDMMRETSERNREDSAVAWDRNQTNWQQAVDYNIGQRDWTETMSNTAYQRATRDMKAAGINPILAYQQGGANTPQVGSIQPAAVGASQTSPVGTGAVGAPAQQRMENALGPALGSAMQGARTVMDLKQLAAQTDQTKAQTALAQANADMARSQTGLNSAQTITEGQRAGLVKGQAAESLMMPSLRAAQTSATSAQAALAREQRATEAERQPLTRAQTGEAIERANLQRQTQQGNQTYGRIGAGPVEQTGQTLDAIRRSIQ
ncbi:MAG: DNA pilot protein [Microviridae sp.]|nr:MAG: DNA pilot protein [Microviridae sp.]